MDIELLSATYWGAVVVIAFWLFWWIVRPVWNVVIVVLRAIGVFLNRYIFQPLSRGLVWLFRFVMRWFMRLLPVGAALAGVAVVVLGAAGQLEGLGPNPDDGPMEFAINGGIIAIGVGALVPFVWRFYATHVGTSRAIRHGTSQCPINQMSRSQFGTCSRLL